MCSGQEVGTQGQQCAPTVSKEYFTEQEIFRHSREHVGIVEVVHDQLRMFMTGRGISELVEGIQDQHGVMSTSRGTIRKSSGKAEGSRDQWRSFMIS
jgi:hypothetical protein